jgi:hypothetical protein
VSKIRRLVMRIEYEDNDGSQKGQEPEEPPLEEQADHCTEHCTDYSSNDPDQNTHTSHASHSHIHHRRTTDSTRHRMFHRQQRNRHQMPAMDHRTTCMDDDGFCADTELSDGCNHHAMSDDVRDDNSHRHSTQDRRPGDLLPPDSGPRIPPPTNRSAGCSDPVTIDANLSEMCTPCNSHDPVSKVTQLARNTRDIEDLASQCWQTCVACVGDNREYIQKCSNESCDNYLKRSEVYQRATYMQKKARRMGLPVVELEEV